MYWDSICTQHSFIRKKEIKKRCHNSQNYLFKLIKSLFKVIPIVENKVLVALFDLNMPVYFMTNHVRWHSS